MSLLQMGSGIAQISIALGISLVIILVSALNMVEKKRLGIFMPFFILGIGVCLTAAFMFYDFFGIAADIFYLFSFVSATGIFFNLWRDKK